MSETPIRASGKVRFDQVCDAFEAAWKAGGPPPLIEEFVEKVEPGQRENLVIELILLDRFYRESRQNELELTEYQARLPLYQAQVAKAFLPVDSEATRGFSFDTAYASSDASGGPPPQAGERIRYFGDYEIVSEIARGGMGVVYRARQISLNRIIALKMILSGHVADPEQIKRFQLEAEAVANLDHPGIVPIYDIGEFNGQHYFSMKLIDGKTLSQLAAELRKDRPRAIDLVARIADAVHHAHQRGILHRDLKPGNILVDSDEQPIVMDFGLARHTSRDHGLTQTGAIVGTPGFMSPEQAAGESVTTAADIYSLGAILYQLVCGRPPHQGESVMKTVMSVMHDEPPKPTSLDPTLATDLELIILKCLNKSPDQRYSSAAAFSADLHAHLANDPVSVRAPSLFEITRQWLGRNFGNILWVPTIAVIVGIVTGFSLWTLTFGHDMSSKVAAYSKFPESERPLLARDWSSWLWLALILSFTFISGMGWLTARLVGTKNRVADIGAGLSVGILAGLIAFVSGAGAVALDAFRLGNQLDREFLYQLAVVDDRSYTHERIATHYPTLEPFSNSDRTTLLMEKLRGDEWNSSVIGIAVGTLIYLFFFGSSGLAQTLVAGNLLRTKSLRGGLLSYSCFSFSFAILYFTLSGPTCMYILLGSSGVLDWLWPLLSAVLATIALASVLRDFHWTLQIGCSLILGMSFVASLGREVNPQVAQHQTEVGKAADLFASQPEKRAYALRLVRAHHEFANLLGNLGRNQLARSEYQKAVQLIESGTEPDSFKNQENILYAQLLGGAGLHSRRLGSFTEAAGYLASHTRMYNSAAALVDAYAQCVLRSEKEPHEFLRNTSALEPVSWFRFARQARALASAKEQAGEDATTWFAEQADRILTNCRDTAAGENWAERKQNLAQWLPSQQRWELFDSGSLPTELTLEALLDQTWPMEAKLIGNENVQAHKTVKTYTGMHVDLIRELGDYEHRVCYARTRFKLASPQQLSFRIGSDDSLKVWIDGQPSMRFVGIRGVFEGHNVVTLNEPLAAGEHTVLFKVVQWTGGWGFILDAEDESGWPIALWPLHHE